MAAQACLPLLEAEAKARQKLAVESTHGHRHIDESLQLVPAPAQPVETTENPTMSPKNNIRASQEAGKIMRVMIDRTERLERNSGSNSQRSQVFQSHRLKYIALLEKFQGIFKIEMTDWEKDN